ITWAASTGGDAPAPQYAGQTATREAPARERGGGSEGERSGGGGGERPSGEQERAEAQGEGETYTVQAGDNIGTIAEKNDTTVEEILAVNPQADPQTLQVGDELKLP
ncbi:MAG TPA: LysM domain-containing protein, partial [Solirubrobacteraceae bacterium]|nr:LysM domain-containing protein [Solirubrobacteraceae bacterium]